MRFIKHHHCVLPELWVIQQLAHERAICAHSSLLPFPNPAHGVAAGEQAMGVQQLSATVSRLPLHMEAARSAYCS